MTQGKLIEEHLDHINQLHKELELEEKALFALFDNWRDYIQ